jgi:spore coat polysaccharide biosynthesis protein SpsF
MKILAIIQARMGSIRLPGKVLKNIHGVPMIERIIQRLLVLSDIDKIVVATTLLEEDNILVDWVNNQSLAKCFRGNEIDVLDRFYKCAKSEGADIIVRVTADDPLKDPRIIQKAINFLYDNKSLDYCSNTINPTYPEGLDVEVFKFSALEKAWIESNLPSEREHVTPYIWKNPNIFKLYNFEYKKNLSDWRWTVDKEVDIEFMNRIYEYFSNEPLVHFESVIEYIEKNPFLLKINNKIIRNEGYLSSLIGDKN